MSDKSKFTPGPWAWFGNSSDFYLATTHSGRRHVMGFARRGLNGAQPRFQVKGIMRAAADLCTFDVGDREVRGFKEARKNVSVYRYDVSGIDHPDARLIAAAPVIYEALKGLLAAVFVPHDERSPELKTAIEQSLAALSAASPSDGGR